jgi:gas vesicle protein
VRDIKQVDLKQVRDDVADRVGRAAKEIGSDMADRVGRAAKELGSGAGSAARELTSTAESSVRNQLPKRRVVSPWTLAIGAFVGAAAAYLFDPQRGKARRTTLTQWTAARVRRGAQSLGQLTRYSTNTASAFPQKMVSLKSAQQRQTPDDLTLRDRIESDVFRDPEMPKGDVNFDVNNGIVTIRGAVDNAFRIASIEKAVFKVPGVTGVENLLHVSGTPAPNKAQARESAH